MRFKQCIFSTLVFSLASCGGGGGGGDDYSCDQYCAFVCNKALNCGFFPQSERQGCESACIAETDRIGRSDDSCRNAQSSFEAATCQEFATTIGLRRDKVEADILVDDLGIILGEEFAE